MEILLVGDSLEDEKIRSELRKFAADRDLKIIDGIFADLQIREHEYGPLAIESGISIPIISYPARVDKITFKIPIIPRYYEDDEKSYVPRYGTHNQNFDTIIKTRQDRLKKSEGFKESSFYRKCFMEMQNCSNFRRMK